MPSAVVPITLGELRGHVERITSQTAPFSPEEVRDAINYGYGRVLRAIRSVRPQHFQSYVDNFAFTSSQTEYDIGSVDPPIWRLTRLVSPSVPANAGSSRIVYFQYRDLRSYDFEDAEAGGTGDRIVYDILHGRLPLSGPGLGYTTTIAAAPAPTVDLVTLNALPAGVGLALGQELSIVGAGPKRDIEGDAGEPDYMLPADYFGRVAGIAGLTVTLTPRLGDSNIVGAAVTLYASRILKIAPAIGSGISGRLYYVYQPRKLLQNADAVDVICSEHRDAIVSYAGAWLLRTVNDSESERWFLDAQEMRSELMQDLDSVSGENGEALGSAFAGIRDY